MVLPTMNLHCGSSTKQAPAVIVLSSEETLRDAVAYWFKTLSIPTIATADGYEANRALKDVGAGLLITDRLLPPWPGLGTFRELQAANPALRVAWWRIQPAFTTANLRLFRSRRRPGQHLRRYSRSRRLAHQFSGGHGQPCDHQDGCAESGGHRYEPYLHN